MRAEPVVLAGLEVAAAVDERIEAGDVPVRRAVRVSPQELELPPRRDAPGQDRAQVAGQDLAALDLVLLDDQPEVRLVVRDAARREDLDPVELREQHGEQHRHGQGQPLDLPIHRRPPG